MFSRPPSRLEIAVLHFSVFLTSFAVLTFEVTLTRIFSVTYSYHYTFLAISMSLLGLGLGGITAHLFSRKGTLENAFTDLASACLLFSLLASLLTVIAVTVLYANLAASVVVMFIPFLAAGILLAHAYRTFAIHGSSIYFADLAGASLGSLGVLVLLAHCDAVNAILFVGFVSSAASLLLAVASKEKRVILAALAGLLLLGLSAQFFHANRILEVQIASDQDKDMYDILTDPSLGAKIVESRWTAFGRTDLVELQKTPSIKMIFVDGGAATKMYRFDGDFSNMSNEVYGLRWTTAYYPYYFGGKDQVLIIGPGGGVDILTALMAGVNHITAVEVNPEVVATVRLYSDFNGGIYTDYDNVHVFTDEGRSFLKRSQAQYDVIMLNIPITSTVQGTGGYSLAENYLFTIDSFKDYFDHLKDQGYLAIVVHHRREVYRLTAIALRVLEQEGVDTKESMRRLVVTEMPHSHFPIFVLKKSAFTMEEADAMYAKSSEIGFTPVYFPYLDSETLDPILAGLAKEEASLDVVVSLLGANYGVDIEPPTDDRPFFYKFKTGLPSVISQSLLASFILCAFATLAWFLGFRSQRRSSFWKEGSRSYLTGFSPFMALYFFTLGLGFMLVEVSLIQRFILFLGHPTTAISVILFWLLFSSGIGSLYTKRWRAESLRPSLKASLIVGILVIFYMLSLPSFFNEFLGYETVIRFIVSGAVLFPLGFFMGMPFPMGVRFIGRKSEETVPWMWGLNSSSSLVGSISAVASAMSFGFSTTLLLGGLSYLAIFSLSYLKNEKL